MISNSRTIKKLLRGCALLAFAGVSIVAAPIAANAQSLQFQPVINTYAGGATTVCTGATDAFGDGCLAAQAILASPHISDTDAAGNLYITDTTNNIVRRVDAVTGIITLFAGSSAGTAGYSGDGGLATAAKLNQPKGLRVDAFGNVVIADLNNNRIRSVNPTTGIITTIAGSATQGSGISTNGTVANALKFQSPFDIAFDKSGNLYISDYYDNQVVLVTAVNGAIVPTSSLGYVLAGTGTAGNTGNGGPSTSAEVYNPRGITVDANGNVYIADFTDSLVRRITSPFQNGTLNLANSVISIYAGMNGIDAYTGDGGSPTAASVAQPQGVTTDAAGNLYIAQYGAGFDVIRKVNSTASATPIISTFAGTGVAGHTGDGGAANAAEVYSPAGLNIDRNGRVFIADSTSNRMRIVMPVTIFGTTTVGASSAASNVVAEATAAVTPKTDGVTANSHDFTLGTMTGCTLGTAAASGAYCAIPVTFSPAAPGIRTTAVGITDSSGNNYFTGVIGIGSAPAITFTPATIATLAGTGVAGNTGNGGPASLAQVSAPRGSTIDASGSLVFADSGSNVIRRIDHTSGAISVLAGSGTSGYAGDGLAATAATAKLNAPTDVVLDPAGNLYIADTGNNVIREVNAATGIISTVAGTGTASYTGDLGLATAATLNTPTGLAMDFAGRIYVADTGNQVIRRFVPNGGYIATIAGTGTANYSGDGAAATLAALNTPSAVTLDAAGDIFIADKGNNVIRKITPLGIISTYAGIHGVTSNSGDGGGATSAGLLSPSDVALDAAGDLYIASGGVVRFVSASGTITTIAGNGLTGAYSGEGGAATSATIPNPATNLAVDSAANVYLSATAANLVFTISSATPRTLNFGLQALSTTSAAQIVTVANAGNLPLVLSGLTVSANYSLQSTSTACTSTSTLAVGASCTLSIAFTPTVSGTTNGSVVITDNTLNGTAVTQTISLTGNSGAPTTTTLTTTPTAITYGNSITFNATVTGTALTGNVTFAVNGITVGTGTLTSGKASLTLTKLAAGRQTVTATYGNDLVNSSSFATATVTVSPAVLTVTAANVSQNAGVAIPAFSYTITGFLYGESSNVVSGTAVFTTTATTASAAGTYPIAESSSTLSASNYTFVYGSGTLTLIPPDFSLTATPTSITIPAGQTAVVTITVTPIGSYTGSVALSCGTLPADDTCTFTASPLVVNSSETAQQSQLVIATDNFNHVAAAIPARRPGQGIEHLMPLSLAALPFLALCGLRRKRISLRALLGIVLLLAVGGMTSCANSGKSIAATGTNSITLTGTDASGLTHTVVLTLTLQ